MTETHKRGIEAQYGGVIMRSRPERIAARELDRLGIPWQYEPVQFITDHGGYIPDFRLMGSEIYLEVKDDMAQCTDRDIGRFHDVIMSGRTMILCEPFGRVIVMLRKQNQDGLLTVDKRECTDLRDACRVFFCALEVMPSDRWRFARAVDVRTTRWVELPEDPEWDDTVDMEDFDDEKTEREAYMEECASEDQYTRSRSVVASQPTDVPRIAGVPDPYLG